MFAKVRQLEMSAGDVCRYVGDEYLIEADQAARLAEAGHVEILVDAPPAKRGRADARKRTESEAEPEGEDETTGGETPGDGE